jgi:hypothetical protein
MALQDVLTSASAPMSVWDGRQNPGNQYTGLDNRGFAYPMVRILGSYNVSLPGAAEMGQTLAVGPRPVAISGTTTYSPTYSQLILCDSTSGSCTIDFPAFAYAGMVIVVKDATGTFGTNQCNLAAGAGQLLEDPASLGTFGATKILINKGNAVTYVYDGTSNWLITALV